MKERFQNTECITSCCKWGCIATDQSESLCRPLATVESTYNRHACIRTGPQNNGRKWSGLMNYFSIYITWTSPEMWCPTRVPSLSCTFGRMFCALLGATVSLFAGYHPQSHREFKCLNQVLKTRLFCLVTQNPSSRNKDLIWFEFTHNTLPCSSSGLSQCEYSYQHTLFPESKVEGTSVKALIRHCRRVWARV